MKIMTVYTEPKKLKTRYIPGDLSDFQREVGGYIEAVTVAELKDHNVVMLVNEEGMMKQLPVNENLIPYFFVGNVVFVGVSNDIFVSLTLKQIDVIHAWLVGLEMLRS